MITALPSSDPSETATPLPRRGYLGFGVEATPATAEFIHEGAERWIISLLDENSPATDSELKLGDDLVAIDGESIISLAQLRARAAAVAPGQHCSIDVLKQGIKVQIALTAQKMPVEQLKSGHIELDCVPWQYGGQRHRLRAVWTHPLPELWPKPRAAVWLLPSAAWISQECPLDPLDPTFQLIDSLTASGISTLRIDRSGLGDSEGPHPTDLDFEAEISMWEEGRAYFFARTSGIRRCLYGRSLGGILAPLIAQQQPFDAVCVWGTASDNWHDASLESVEYQRKLKGMSGPQLQQSLAETEALQALVYIQGLSPKQARIKHPELAHVAPDEYCGSLVHDRIHTFYSQLQTQDIALAWSKVTAEILAVHAEYDIVLPEVALTRLVERAGPHARFLQLRGIDHFMHERDSLKEAVRLPWGGRASPLASRTLGEFFAG